MNILFLCDEYPPGRHGGIGTVVQLLARELVQQGHKVVVAGFYDWGYCGEDEFDDRGVKVYRFRRLLSSGLLKKQDSLPVRAFYKAMELSGIFQADVKYSLKKYKAFLDNIIQQHEIDIIEMTDYHDYIRFCNKTVLFPEMTLPTVVKLHGSITYFSREAGETVAPYIYEIERDVLMKADKVVSVSEYTAKHTAEYLDYPEHIDVLYNGIDLPEIDKPITKKPGKVVFTGTLLPKKGIYSLVQAWNKVIEKHPKSELFVFGKGPIDKIKELLSTKALPTVHFEGHVPRKVLFEHLAEANMAVFPSFAECFALGPMEAMACNTAVIYSTRTSGPELIDHMIDGVLADPADIDDLADNICNLLEKPDICSRLAQAGKQKIIEHFSMPVIAGKHVQYYESVINQNPEKQHS